MYSDSPPHSPEMYVPYGYKYMGLMEGENTFHTHHI